MEGIFNKLNPLAIGIIGMILVILFSAMIISVVVLRKYKGIGESLKEIKQNDQGIYGHKVLNLIVAQFKEASKNSSEVNTQAIIEKNFNNQHAGLRTGERFVKNAISLMIILGLLGTFYGLTLSIGNLVNLLSDTSGAEALSSMDSIVGGLISSVKGMSVAFITSLFGIASSIILTIFGIFQNISEVRESVMVEIEEYLDNKVAMEFKHNNEDGNLKLINALEVTFEKFGGRIEKQLKDVMDFSGQNFAAATMEMGNSSASLTKSIQIFDKSLEDFSENTRNFSEFNYNLRTNIERMNVTFADFVENMKRNSK